MTAKMQWSLFLPVLVGLFGFLVATHNFVPIETHLSWKQAQRYCRQNYTDLATLRHTGDVKFVKKLCKDECWIGLYSNPGKENRSWHWSQPGEEVNETELETRWNEGEPNDCEDLQNCVALKNHKWNDEKCEDKYKFICYDANKEKPYHLVENKKSWTAAQTHCRKDHTDLVGGHRWLEDKDFNKSVKSWPKKVWIGLFRDTWRWSDGSDASFRLWDEAFRDDETQKKCALLNRQNKWRSESCDKQRPFLCYQDMEKSTTASQTQMTGSSIPLLMAQMVYSTPASQTQAMGFRNPLLMAQMVYSTAASQTPATGSTIPPSTATSQTPATGSSIPPSTTASQTQATGSSIPPSTAASQTQATGSSIPPSTAASQTQATGSSIPPSTTASQTQATGSQVDHPRNDMILIDKNKTWVQALSYCRQHHDDLVSITDKNLQESAARTARQASSPFVWLGLRYTCTLDFWFWVSDHPVKYKNWKSTSEEDDCDLSAAMDKENALWFKKPDEEKFNFICSKDEKKKG